MNLLRLAGPFLLEKEEDRVLLIKAVLHASDISNPVRPFHVNCVMSTSVHREFRSGSTSFMPCWVSSCNVYADSNMEMAGNNTNDGSFIQLVVSSGTCSIGQGKFAGQPLLSKDCRHRVVLNF